MFWKNCSLRAVIYLLSTQYFDESDMEVFIYGAMLITHSWVWSTLGSFLNCYVTLIHYTLRNHFPMLRKSA